MWTASSEIVTQLHMLSASAASSFRVSASKARTCSATTAMTSSALGGRSLGSSYGVVSYSGLARAVCLDLSGISKPPYDCLDAAAEVLWLERLFQEVVHAQLTPLVDDALVGLAGD